MDILIEKITATEIQRWGGVAQKVTIPGTSDEIHVGGNPPKRPVDVGPDHFLADVTDDSSPTFDTATQKLGAEEKVVDVDARTVIVTRQVVDKTAPEIADEKEAAADGELGPGATPTQQVIVDMAFDFENRLRVLEGRPSVTREKVRDTLKDLYKGHLP